MMIMFRQRKRRQAVLANKGGLLLLCPRLGALRTVLTRHRRRTCRTQPWLPRRRQGIHPVCLYTGTESSFAEHSPTATASGAARPTVLHRRVMYVKQRIILGLASAWRALSDSLAESVQRYVVSRG